MFKLEPLGGAVKAHVGGGTPSRQVASFWDGGIPWASVKDFLAASPELFSTQETISYRGLNASASHMIPAGTPLVCTRMAVGRAAMAMVPLAINQDVKALFPAANFDASYLLRLMQYAQRLAIGQAIGSTVQGIRISNYLALDVPQAPTIEQPKIAEVLATIELVIKQTGAVIEKLKQAKQGLLHDLLTRGVDANGEIRPRYEDAPHLYQESELGLIPKPWHTELLDNIAIRGSGHTPSKSISSYWNGGIKWVSLADSNKLDMIYIETTDKEISELGIANSSAVKHTAGTVILSRDAGIGKSAILADEMAVSQHFMTWSCGAGLHNIFLYFWLQKEKPRFEAIAMGSTIKTIGLSFFKQLRIIVPPLSEQIHIANMLLLATANIRQYENESKKLTMLKSSLMDDLLTGRVRVTPLLALEGTSP